MVSFDGPVVITGWSLHTLLSAARATYNNMLHIPDSEITPLLMNTMTVLDAAIDEGHKVLGTDRGAADHYVSMIGGLTVTQAANAKNFIEKMATVEGLTEVDNSE